MSTVKKTLLAAAAAVAGVGLVALRATTGSTKARTKAKGAKRPPARRAATAKVKALGDKAAPKAKRTRATTSPARKKTRTARASA